MKVVCKLRETSMESAKEKIPGYFEGEIQGNGIFKITLSEGQKYILDSNNVYVSEGYFDQIAMTKNNILNRKIERPQKNNVYSWYFWNL